MRRSHPMNCRSLHGMLAAILAIVSAAQAVTPTPEEMSLARQCIDRLANPATPVFSFTYDGAVSRDVLPGWPKQQRDTADGVTITWTDPGTGLVVECVAKSYADWPAVDWVLHLTNTGKQDTPIIQDIRPLDWHVPGTESGCMLHHARGDTIKSGNKSAESFAPLDSKLAPDNKEHLTLSPVGGRSSDTTLPFFNLEWQNQGAVVAIGWSGQWQAEFGYDPPKAGAPPLLRMRAGMQKTHLKLHPGESIRTPRILMVFWNGPGALRGENMLRQTMLAHYCPRREGQVVWAPICGSVNRTDPDGTYEGPHLRVMQPYAERGIEVFWSDMDPQQWYPGDFPGGTGNWEVDRKKYPRGLGVIGDAAHKAGLQYLLWFEPERVAPGTAIDRDHADWVMRPPSKGSGLFRLHDEKARRWLTDLIDRHITEAKLDWVRWDFNIEPLGFWQRNDTPDRQGITEIRHIEGLYAMWDELRTRHPGLMIDNCASGGRRIDLETCSRSIPLWHSDLHCFPEHRLAAEQAQNVGLWRWVPMHGAAAFGYEPSYAFRSAMTSGNILCASDEKNGLNTAAAENADAVRRTVETYKKLRPFLLGDFYPLFAHGEDETQWFGYQFHRPDLDAGVAVVFRREKCSQTSMRIQLQGVDPQREYSLTLDDGGPVRQVRAKLTSLNVQIPTPPGSCVIYCTP